MIKAENARLLMRSQRTRQGRSTGYGLGWEVHPTPFGLTAGHTGNGAGGTAFLVLYPERGAVVALAANLGYAAAASPPPIDPSVPGPPHLLRYFLRP